jgi:O-antigen/teichoic acid export membrane protein
MRREFLVNIAFLLAINLIIKPAYIFGIDLQVQNVVGAADYGLFAALLSLAYILQIINDAGIHQYNNQRVAKHREGVADQYSLFLGLKMWLGLLYMAICFLLGLALGYDWATLPLFLHIALNQILLSWLFFMRSNVSGLGFYRRDSLLSIMDKIWMILLVGAMLYLPQWRSQFKIEWFVWAQSASLVATIIIARLFLRGHNLPRGLNLKWQDFYPLLKKSMPFALTVLLMSGYYRLDTLMLERLLPGGDIAAGHYYMAFRLLDVLNSFAYLFGALLFPMFSFQLGQKKDIQPLLSMSTTLLLTGSAIAALCLTRFAEPIITLLYHQPVQEAVFALQYLAWAFIPIAMMHIFMALLAADLQLKAMNKVLLFAMGLNLILLTILIPRYQVVGAAVAVLITQLVVAAMIIGLTGYKFKLAPNPSLWIKVILFVLAISLLTFLPSPFTFSWSLQLILYGSTGILIALILGLLPLRQLISALINKDKS